MIKKFIDKLLGKTPKAAAAAPDVVVAAPHKSTAKAHPLGKRVEVPQSEHGIDLKLVDERAIKVVQTLAGGGFEAYIVGGAVRDLLLGLRPKDFDVATNATPEQVKSLFRRAFIIGRRFRIVHVVFGRGRQDLGLSEVIEVSTFRALMDVAGADQIAGNEKTSNRELANRPAQSVQVIDAEGRVLRDNVWGPQVEDAARRDFTVNAMYYDPQAQIVVDYHGGIKDAKKKLLRMIGDPETRYREDPVRIIRAIRFAAKLGFEIEAKTRAPIKTMAALLENVPPSRMFDEMFKLLQTGHSLASLDELRKQGLTQGTFPLLDAVLDDANRESPRQRFVTLALADTDRRVGEGKPVAPSFLLACMLWHDVLGRWQQNKARGEAPLPALQQAIDAVFDARIGDISGRGKLAADMRDTWLMQPRFERRGGNSPFTLVQQPRFRAGFDFLRLRAQVGEVEEAFATWWEDFSLATEDERERLIEAAREQGHGRRRVATVEEDAAADEAADAVKDPVRKRRRRRRKPGGEGGGSVPAAAAAAQAPGDTAVDPA